jgi:hypothetical protein
VVEDELHLTTWMNLAAMEALDKDIREEGGAHRGRAWR